MPDNSLWVGRDENAFIEGRQTADRKTKLNWSDENAFMKATLYMYIWRKNFDENYAQPDFKEIGWGRGEGAQILKLAPTSFFSSYDGPVNGAKKKEFLEGQPKKKKKY